MSPKPSPSDDIASLHGALVAHLKRIGLIRTPSVEAAFRAVPRHVFLPGAGLQQAYSDEAIPVKFADGRPISSSSQPAIMAIMLEQLALEPGHHVLEIGAGTGYNAALMAHIVGEGGRVVTVDIDADLVESAQAHLQAAGYARVQVVCGDGGFGFPQGAPYDRIILTVGASEIAPAWREQLKPEGRLVLPLSIKGPQKSVAFARQADHFVSLSVQDCGFMSLRGAFAEPDRLVQLAAEPGLYLSVDDPRRVKADAVYRWLTGPSRDLPTGVHVRISEIWGSLNQWLALREADACDLSAEDGWAERGLAPCLIEIWGQYRICATSGLLGEAGLSVLTRRPDRIPFAERQPDETPFELFVRAFGPDEALAQRLIKEVKTWDALGRPGTAGMRIRAYPAEAAYTPQENESVVTRRWTRLVLDWPSPLV